MNTHHLAVVMFTDIEGYTGLMQTDEAAAMELRARHREVFEAVHQQFNGEVIQYFGDGTLSTFKSSRDAVSCAIEMQKAFRESPKVPLRIGIHSGDIIKTDDAIAGDAVNVASRIESLGVSGSIFVSAKVYDDIKNQKGIKTESMGFFEFKNVDKSEEVFSIANQDLIVPDPESLTGKTKVEDFRKEADRTFLKVIKDLWDRKVFLAAGAYLLGLWLLVKAAGFLISTYAISPYWTDILLVFFVSFLPSVILHSYYHNKLEINRMRLVEKITIPSNAMLSVALLFFLFGGKNLGAMTQTVVSTDEFGHAIEKQTVKEEFITEINFYPFTNETGDSTLDWLGGGLAMLLGEDLVQCDYVLPDYSLTQKNLGAMLGHAEASNTPIFTTGTIEKQDSIYTLTSQLYYTQNGKLIQERVFQGENIFDLADQITVQIQKGIGLSASIIQNAKDLPVASITTDKLEALRFYTQARQTAKAEKFRNHAKADQLDPTFALNNYHYAMALFQDDVYVQAPRTAIDKAMKHRTNVCDLQNMRIRTLYYNIHDQPDKAIALREMQVALNPDDKNAYSALISEYYRNGYYEKSLATSRKLYALSPELSTLEKRQTYYLRLLNCSEEALEIMNDYITRFPNDQNGWERLGEIHLDLDNVDEAEKNFKKVSLMNPEYKGIHLMLEHIQFLKEKEERNDPTMLKPFTGLYKGTFNDRIWDLRSLGKKVLAIDERNSTFFYPINDTTLILLNGLTLTFTKSSSGAFYKFGHADRIDGSNVEYYTLDSTIIDAGKLSDAGDDEATLVAYEAAYAQNPSHYFLQDVIQYFKFKKGQDEETLRSSWQRIVGNYQGGMEIKIEADGLYAWGGPGSISGKILAISEKEFVVYGRWGCKMVIHEEAGKVVHVDGFLPGGEKITLMKND